MEKKVILEIRDDNLTDKNGKIIWSGFSASGFEVEELPTEESTDIPQLVSMGMSADDLIRLKLNKVI